MPPSARVRVPASTSNLGPGFDCLGLALGLHNDVRVEPAGATEPPASPFLADVAQAFFAGSGLKPFPFRAKIEGDVPQARGLGSSVTVRLGVLMGLNRLCGNPLDRNQLFQRSAELEGHPDNAAAACFGGFSVVRKRGREPAEVLRYDVDPALKVVLCVPDFEIQTTAARKVLPTHYPREDVLTNLTNTAAIVAAFTSRDYGLLRGAFTDRIHQPYRQHLVPFLPDVIAAGTAAGALGGFLSGSGSTIACMTLHQEQEVARAMLAAVPGQAAVTRVICVDNAGAKWLDESDE
ncbi:MAG: homoserine kinase [Verrucomicrobia bacterium]|nr:homoserine kinase [Verrucomicrobiota bacterium]